MSYRVLMVGLATLVCVAATARAEDAKKAYPAMAPLDRYLIANAADEIGLARSAAPASISADADVMTLNRGGYETAIRGKNGFVCMVWRSWTAGLEDAEFWNPKLRAPICLNAAAVRTVLPGLLERTHWVLAGVSTADMMARTRQAIAAHTFVLPAPGAMAYMMSKEAYLGDAAGHWHPHLMFFLPHTESAAWGADLPGSPVSAAQDSLEPTTTFFVPVQKWSDGAPVVPVTH